MPRHRQVPGHTRLVWRIVEQGPEHARGLAECHIASWRESYRGLVHDHVLDALDVEQRADQAERMRQRYPGATRLALVDDVVVGFATAGPSIEADAVRDLQLYAIYLRRAYQGSGIADELLTAATGDAPCQLWVFEQNPRAHAFYRRHGFHPDGARRTEEFSAVPIVRLVR